LGILYGFFYFWVISFLIFARRIKAKLGLNLSDQFVLILILLGTILIFIPETVYFKDIFTTYPRANTMFKIAYQVFIILSLASGYIIIRVLSETRALVKKNLKMKVLFPFYLIFAFILFCLISIYPVFAINSYYNNLSKYYGLNGINYLKQLYPSDYEAILWINKNIKGQPTMLEAQGDSYTDYERVSVNTGLPTIIGWTVHEWFWRNNYDIVATRINDVKTIYETSNLSLAKQLLKQYKVSYVFVGTLERQKYLNLQENKFNQLGKVIFQNGETRIYKLTI
jgi:YYY domain-containing protein